MLNLKRKTKTIVACSALLSLLLLSSWSLLDPTYNFLESVSPKTASNEISIITPEDKTYTGPMSGYFLAIYGFENDYNDEAPSGWIDSSGDGCFAKVIQNSADHEKVLHLHDDSQSNSFILENEFDSARESGSVEMWVRGTFHDYKSHYISLVDDASQDGVFLRIYGGQLKYKKPDGTFGYICQMNSDTWYHIRLDFECGNGQYMGLAADKFYCWVDGTKKGSYSFRTALTSANRLKFKSYSQHTGVDIYVDAVGYSWDPNYNIGDNLDEGLLLSFESTIALDWMGYSLDGQPTKTILGDTTIPLPENGAHDIQVFGKDSLETMYASDIRYFNIFNGSIIDIVTPESITYTAPMAGYYPGTYGFESDTDGSMPRDWIKIKPNDGNADAYVVGPAYGHNKVIRLYDPWQWPLYYPTYVQVKNSFAPQDEGTIDFYLYYTNVVYINLLYVNEDPEFTVEVVKICFGPLYISYWKDGQWIPIYSLPVLIANQWYHCQVHFKTEWDKWKLTINDNSMPYLEYTNPGYSINTFMISTDPIMHSYNTYIDAVGYSWDPYYDIEDNKYEGLLLEFNPDDLYDMSYTLDGASRTIYGDTVFPMPKSGPHTISVDGTDQYGADYWGESSFSVQYEDGFGIFMWASDAADGIGASPPFEWDEAVEGNMHHYKDILYKHGFRKFYFYRDVSQYSEDSDSEYEAIMDRLEKRIDINDKVFFYIRGHGKHETYEDYVYISPARQVGYELGLKNFRADIDEFDSIYKGVLVEACQSGNWAGKLNKRPYVVALSSSDIYHNSSVDKWTKEGYFSHHFWAQVDFWGWNAQEAYYIAKDHDNCAWQNPQGFFNPPDPEDPDFMFFDEENPF